MSARPPISWRETRARLAADARRVRALEQQRFGYRPLSWWLAPAFQCILLHRLGHYCWQRGYGKLGRLFAQLNLLLTGADFHPASDLGPGALIPSPCGTSFSGRAGADLTLMALAGVGGNIEPKDVGAGPGLPLLGDRVVVNAGAGLQGAIRIGDDCLIDAGAGSVADMPPDTLATLATRPLVGSHPPPAPARTAPESCDHGRWCHTWAHFRTDLERYLDELGQYQSLRRSPIKRLSALLTNQLATILLYRLSHALHRRGWPRLARGLARLNLLFNKAWFHPAACIGPGLFLPHPVGVVFHGRAGAGLTIYDNSLCLPSAQAAWAPLAAAPLLGTGVVVGGHAAVIGPIRVCDDTRLAPKVQLERDVIRPSVVVTPMARRIYRPRPAHPPDVAAPPPAQPLGWRAAWAFIAQDWRRARRSCRDVESGAEPRLPPGGLCTLLHRLSHWAYSNGHRRLARWIWLTKVYLTGADIAPSARIGAGLFVPHPAGVSLDCDAGENLEVLALAGAGRLLPGHADEILPGSRPRLGNNVCLSHHAGVYGAIQVGDDAWLGPGSLPAADVPAGAALLARPVRTHSLERSATPAVEPPHETV